tara:strand:+ start:44983 stop:46464 length:1482 start_codon:yes stop_codon:yes gene_type:complete
LNPLKKLAKQTAIYGLSSVVGRLLNYLLVPLYTRYFLPEEYGIVTELYAYVAFLVVILTYGIETSFFRYSQKLTSKQNIYSTALISLILTSTLFIFIIFYLSQPIANFLQYPNNTEYIKFFALIIGLDAISAISFAKLRELGNATRFALIRLLNIFINIGLNLFFIIYCPYAIENGLNSIEFVQSIYNKEYGVGYIFIANLISSIVTFIMLIPEMTNSTWKFDKSLWKQMMIYGFPLLIAGLAGITNETIDRILLKHLLSDNLNVSAEIGLYGAFYKLSILIVLFIQTFRFAAEPFFFNQAKEKNSKKTYAQVLKYFTIICLFIFLFVTIFYDFIILFLGSNYHDHRGFLTVSILLFANIFLGIYYNLSIWYKLSDKTIYGAYLSIFGAIITITLNFIMIPIHGFVGSAWVTLICYFSMTVASYYLGKKHYKIDYPVKRILFYLLITALLYYLNILLNHIIVIKFLFLLIFLIIIFILEKPKKVLISNPKLFE